MPFPSERLPHEQHHRHQRRHLSPGTTAREGRGHPLRPAPQPAGLGGDGPVRGLHGPGHGHVAQRHRRGRPGRQGRALHLRDLLRRRDARGLRVHPPHPLLHPCRQRLRPGRRDPGPARGFFGGFALLGTYLFFSACITGACAVFFEAMLGEFGLTLPTGTWVLITVVAAAAALLLNLRESTVTTRTLLAIGMVGIVVMVIFSLVVIARVASGDAPVSTGIDLGTLLPGEASWTAIMTASVFGFLSWAGFESGTSLGEETRDPKRTIPRALTYAVVLAGVIYTLVMFAQTIGYGTDTAGQEAFAGASSTLTELGSTYIGPWFAVIISIIAFCVAFASLLSCSAAAARLVFALARDGFGPSALARTSPRTGAPTVATVTVLMLTVLLVLLLAAIGGGPVEVYYWYATIATLCMVVAYGMASVGAIRHTFRPDSPIRRWEVVLPAGGIVYLVYVYVVQVAGQEAPYTYFPWIAAAWCLAGLAVILAAPKLAERIGARLTKEDLG
ncbi:APC family permease [Serinicoccus sp. CUA-874]|uniref:APC family permease n=1 Tax=Serinicoccus sp. CUA-874 TaxID=1517939 RepID=UPI001ED9D6B2|nr:APC family permease [Serinicoccus sp. CUA-874]